jgi:hypothetical protein
MILIIDVRENNGSGGYFGGLELKDDRGNRRTRWQGFLELVGLLIVMEDECVQQTLAADLEFDLGGLLVPLYPCSWDEMLASAPFYLEHSNP